MNQNSKDLGNKIESDGSLTGLEKANNLIKILENDLDACDFKWSLFVAAAINYKYDSLLKPFPSAYVANRILNINCLRDRIACVPDFCDLLEKLRHFCDHPNTHDNCINDDTIDLLYWCLISAREQPVLKSINRSDVSIIWFVLNY